MKQVYILALAAALGISGCAVPRAAFEYERSSDQAPSLVHFQNTSENAEMFLWDFGDGSTSSESEPRHRYVRSGQYTVTLRAIKGKQTKEHQKTLKVAPPESCLIEIRTEYGTMTLRLFDETPAHRDNFLKLAEEGFYDGLIFHRVINGFMIQGGDPDSRDAPPGKALGSGGPGYQVPAEFADDLVHVKGALAAARTGDQVNPQKKSSGSQFYIVQGKPVTEQELQMIEARKGIQYTPDQREQYLQHGGTPFLDYEYTVFGQVIDGLDVIDKIAAVRTERGDRPSTDVVLHMIVIK